MQLQNQNSYLVIQLSTIGLPMLQKLGRAIGVRNVTHFNRQELMQLIMDAATNEGFDVYTTGRQGPIQHKKFRMGTQPTITEAKRKAMKIAREKRRQMEAKRKKMEKKKFAAEERKRKAAEKKQIAKEKKEFAKEMKKKKARLAKIAKKNKKKSKFNIVRVDSGSKTIHAE